MYNKPFKTSFFRGEPWVMSPCIDLDPNKRDVAYLDQYGQERWDTVLHYLVNSSQQTGVSLDAVNVLLHSGLMTKDSDDTNQHMITKAGFQFLLMETSSQVWYFMLQYLDTVAMRNMSIVECLNFLFQLSFATLGKDYTTDGLNNHMLKFLQHLREFGLVYQRKRNSGRFYPTRLALNIATGEKKGMIERHREGYIVVETNYRVYAYTTSDLQVSLIGLFAEPLYRFPNLSVFLVTRDSVRQAYKGGITAAQIVRFLRMHAHSKQVEEKNKHNHSVIPPTVIDQVGILNLLVYGQIFFMILFLLMFRSCYGKRNVTASLLLTAFCTISSSVYQILKQFDPMLNKWGS